MTKRLMMRIVSVSAGLAVTVIILMSRRNVAMERLYDQALDGSPSGESRAAVRQLAEYRGSQSTGMLLAIALSIESRTTKEVQAEALKVLASRKDPQTAVELALSLRPYRGLEYRRNVAAALRDLPCNRECVAAVLGYLELVWLGEPNSEDRIASSSPSAVQVYADYKKEQQSLYADLYAVFVEQ